MSLLMSEKEWWRLYHFTRGGSYKKYPLDEVWSADACDDGLRLVQREGPFDEVEARRLGEALKIWHGAFVEHATSRQHQDPNAYLGVIMRMIEDETNLSLLVALEQLERILKSEKRLPSIADLMATFEERNRLVERFAYPLYSGAREFPKLSRSAFETYDQIFPKVAERLPGLPEPAQLQKDWEAEWQMPFGIVGELGKTREFVPVFNAALEALDPWPLIPILSLHHVAKIPEEETLAALEVLDDHLATSNLKPGTCEPPELWREILEMSLPTKEAEDFYEWRKWSFDPARQSMTNAYYKDDLLRRD